MARLMEGVGKTSGNMDTLTDYTAVISAVSRATGVPETRVFSRQKGQVNCDARWIAVQLLCDLGYYTQQIADLSGMTARNVNLILSNIKMRQPGTWKQFGKELEACRKALGITTMA